MSNQQPPMRGADAQRHLLSGQVNPFSFDPKNEAGELGFKPGEPWNPQIATKNEMIGLKKAISPGDFAAAAGTNVVNRSKRNYRKRSPKTKWRLRPMTCQVMKNYICRPIRREASAVNLSGIYTTRFGENESRPIPS